MTQYLLKGESYASPELRNETPRSVISEVIDSAWPKSTSTFQTRSEPEEIEPTRAPERKRKWLATRSYNSARVYSVVYEPALSMTLEYWVLTFHPPAQKPLHVGVLVFEPARSRVYMRLRRDWDSVVDSDEAEILAGYEQLLLDITVEQGSSGLARLLEDTLSNAVQIAIQNCIEAPDARSALDLLYTRYVLTT